MGKAKARKALNRTATKRIVQEQNPEPRARTTTAIATMATNRTTTEAKGNQATSY